VYIKHFLSEERTCAKKESLFPSEKAFTEKCYRCSFGKAFLFKKRFVLKEKIIHTSCDKNRKSFY